VDEVASGCARGLKNKFSMEISFIRLELPLHIDDSGFEFNWEEDGSEKLVL